MHIKNFFKKVAKNILNGNEHTFMEMNIFGHKKRDRQLMTVSFLNSDLFIYSKTGQHSIVQLTFFR